MIPMERKAIIAFEVFERLDLRVGTVVEAHPHPRARKPAYVLRIDFGSLGERLSSAQLCENYRPEELVGRQVVAACNFEAKPVAGVRSEVLVLGALSAGEGTVLLQPERAVHNGSAIG
jgi:tRNA-binding protein